MYCYFIVDKYIIQVPAYAVRNHPGRFATYHQTVEALWERAQKYGYTQVTLK